MTFLSLCTDASTDIGSDNANATVNGDVGVIPIAMPEGVYETADPEPSKIKPTIPSDTAPPPRPPATHTTGGLQARASCSNYGLENIQNTHSHCTTPAVTVHPSHYLYNTHSHCVPLTRTAPHSHSLCNAHCHCTPLNVMRAHRRLCQR